MGQLHHLPHQQETLQKVAVEEEPAESLSEGEG